LAARKLDCLVVTHPANWYYLTGFTGDAGALVLSQDATTL
jgi:Xaa-Pro aminopeptidase